MNALSLAGGGMLGYGQAIILTEFEKKIQAFCFERFELIGSTSVGCIIGSALSIGVPAEKIQEFFTMSGPKIFVKSIVQEIEQVAEPLYGEIELEAALQEMLGDATLTSCKTKFVATSYDYASDRPVYFKSYEKSSEDECQITIGYDSGIKLWQVCRASAAAQHYFPGFVYNNMLFLDGGNTGDNSPDVLVIAEGTAFSPVDKIKTLSIGTGTSKWEVNPMKMRKPGILTVGIETIQITFSAGVDAQVYKARKIQGNNHYYISPVFESARLSIDDVSQLSLIGDAARKAILQQGQALNEF